MGHAPANVFQLCEHLGIAETEFYHHFGSLEKVEESVLLFVGKKLQRSLRKMINSRLLESLKRCSLCILLLSRVYATSEAIYNGN